MDEEYAQLILGQHIYLLAAVLAFHNLLASYADSSSTAAGELMARSDALGSCLLQAQSIILREA